MKYIALTALFLYGCATLSPEKKTYLAATASSPLNFRIAKDSTNEVWKRALSFLLGYSKGKVVTVTDSLLQTREPNELMGEYGYKISFKREPDSTTVVVNCTASSISFISRDDNAVQNAHIAARYIQSGELPYPDLIFR